MGRLVVDLADGIAQAAVTGNGIFDPACLEQCKRRDGGGVEPNAPADHLPVAMLHDDARAIDGRCLRAERRCRATPSRRGRCTEPDCEQRYSERDAKRAPGHPYAPASR